MTVPLVLLAFLSLFGGFVGVPQVLGGVNRLEYFLAPVLTITAAHAAPVYGAAQALELLLMGVTTVVVLGGGYYAYRIYLRQPALAENLAQRLRFLHRLSHNKYFVDEAYALLVVGPFKRLATTIWAWVDVKAVDGVVNGMGRSVAAAGSYIRRAQSGLIQHYAAVILFGVVFILVYLYVE